MADARALVGKPVSRALNEATMERAERFLAKRKRSPTLFVFSSPDPSAQSYLRSIRSNASRVGVKIEEFPIKEGAATQTVVESIEQVGRDGGIDGILVQTPVVAGVDFAIVAGSVEPSKDVDGISPIQAGLLFQGRRLAMAPSTARACMEILDFYKYSLAGVELVVIGRSLVVGRPAALLALSRNATVTWCHTKTQGLPSVCKRAEVLISAAGSPGLVNSTFVRAGVTILDVGISVDESGTLRGDVDVRSISSIAAAYTPVPGGVGPVTTSCLFANVVDAAERRSG
jgi:methylenetetrahydrofolate dehydrogenase (NADP+)/methenyltetrahydrofolate cyclohydrolase